MKRQNMKRQTMKRQTMKRQMLIVLIGLMLPLLMACSSGAGLPESPVGTNPERQNKVRNESESVVQTETINGLELPVALNKDRGLFEASVQEYIKINLEPGETLPWESKFGGDPYMPKGYAYPIDEQNRPMKLLAQINFDEVPDIGLYPKKGILAFYISFKDDVYGLDFEEPTSQKNFRVIYMPDVVKDEAALVTDFGFVNFGSEDYFPVSQACKVTFEKRSEPVGAADYRFEKLFKGGSISYFESFNEQWEALHEWYYDHYSSGGHKMGGYAFFTQEDPRTYNQKVKAHEVLLLQVDSDMALDMMWGDSGVGNFFIRPEDLKNLDFTKVLYNWDCY